MGESSHESVKGMRIEWHCVGRLWTGQVKNNTQILYCISRGQFKLLTRSFFSKTLLAIKCIEYYVCKVIKYKIAQWV